MDEDKNRENAIRAELKKLSEAYVRGNHLPPVEFMKRYQQLLDELYAAQHPELRGEGHA